MIQTTTLENGLTILVEEMPHLESVSYDLEIPGGIIFDPEHRQGISLILAELTSRGVDSMNAKALSDAFDDIGARHGESGGFDTYVYRGTVIGEHLDRALSLSALMVQQPTLPHEEIEGIQSLLIQDIQSLDDNPARRAFHELGSRYYPSPYNRSSLGSQKAIESTSREDLVAEWKRTFRPRGAVLSVAGHVDSAAVVEMAQRHLGRWSGDGVVRPGVPAFPKTGTYHVPFESAQLQILIAYPSVPFGHRLYYAAKLLSGILSGGMFGRLFVEVREKRGLCYSVYSRHSAAKEYGTCSVYAGTTPERAHETLEVIVAELDRLKGTITVEELNRARANIKAGLVIGEESASSRASSNAHDWILDRRIRTLDEIAAAIDQVTIADLDAVCEEFPHNNRTLLTLGSREIV